MGWRQVSNRCWVPSCQLACLEVFPAAQMQALHGESSRGNRLATSGTDDLVKQQQARPGGNAAACKSKLPAMAESRGCRYSISPASPAQQQQCCPSREPWSSLQLDRAVGPGCKLRSTSLALCQPREALHRAQLDSPGEVWLRTHRGLPSISILCRPSSGALSE